MHINNPLWRIEQTYGMFIFQMRISKKCFDIIASLYPHQL